MVVGAREDVDVDEFKRNQADFVLWFTSSKFEHHELLWDSPWGMGYPGWHIECSGISIKYLGEYLDIHGGGVDNIFPHHTNEIAQSEAYLGHKWCNYWFHNEHLNDSTGKMSKSNGEFLTTSLLEEKGYNPIAYRFFCLNSHYRKVLVFTYDALDQAQNTYDKLITKIKNIVDSGELNQELIDKYVDSAISGVADPDSLNNVDLGEDIINFIIENKEVLEKEKPDIIISTHFFVSHMCSFLKQKGKITSTLATIITDYGDDPYNEWTSNHKYVDYIFVAHNEIKK